MNSEKVIKNLIQKKKLYGTRMNLLLIETATSLKVLLEELSSQKPLIIALVGGVASGKTTLANELTSVLANCLKISTDDFVKGTREWRRNEIVKKNLSPTKKYDIALLNEKLAELCANNFTEVQIPKYDESSGRAIANDKEKYIKIVRKPDNIIVEGDFQFISEPHIQIYLHTNDDVRTRLRIARDRVQRGEIDMEKLLEDIDTRNQQQHFPFTLPEASKSDIIIVTNLDNSDFYYNIYL